LHVTESVSAAPAERAGGRSYKAVYLGFFGLLLFAGAAALVMYFKLLHYRRVAALHLPSDTTAAARIDVEKVVLFEPVRKHLLPLANTLRAGDPRLKTRLKRLEQHTRIDFAVDLREIVVARGPAPGDWIIIFGGLFPTRNVIGGLRQVLAEEGLEARLSPSERILSLAGGLALGHAEDGCILIAASAPRLESALPQQNAFQRLGLLPDGPGAFAFSGDFLKSFPHGELAMTRAEINDIARATGQLRLGNPAEITAQVELRSKAEPADAERLVRAMMREFQVHGEYVRFLERDARIHSPAPGLVQMDTRWERADIDRSAESLARALRAWAEGP
jgi:hypothetical protein